ncbi:hypothetical protein RI054_27g112680 [Pseudoscourfieldia marina]
MAPPPLLLAEVQKQLKKLGHGAVPNEVVLAFLSELAEEEGGMETLLAAASAAGAVDDVPLKTIAAATNSPQRPVGNSATRQRRSLAPPRRELTTNTHAAAQERVRPATAPPSTARVPLAARIAPNVVNAPTHRQRPRTPATSKPPWRANQLTAQVPTTPVAPAHVANVPTSRPRTADGSENRSHKTDRVKRHQSLTRTWSRCTVGNTTKQPGEAAAAIPLARRRDEPLNFHLRFAEAHRRAEQARRTAVTNGRARSKATRALESSGSQSRVPW